MAKIYVSNATIIGRILDVLMVPVMYILSGTFLESPQQTHRWNNRRLEAHEVEKLDGAMIVKVGGKNGACSRFLHHIPLFHMPIFGGWREYVVIEPVGHGSSWRIGWCADVNGVSRLYATGPIRVLIGNSPVSFFGLDVHTRAQIPIEVIGRGTIGDCSLYCKSPLF